MQSVLLVIHLIIAIGLVGLILVQRSEGGALGIGGGGGNGGMGSIFSARGVGNALTRVTAFLAVAFFVTSMALSVLAIRGKATTSSAFDSVTPTTTQGTPAPDTGEAILPNLGQQPTVPTNH